MKLLHVSMLGLTVAVLGAGLNAQTPGSTPARAELSNQKKEKAPDTSVRSVEGVVRDANNNPIAGAVVKLKDKKTLQVRSFITSADGSYHFHGLSRSVDYELKADHNNQSSAVRTLSVFDSRTKAVVNLKIEPKETSSKESPKS